MFYTHKYSIKLCSNTSIIELYVSKVIFAPLAGLELRVTQIFLFFFHNSFFFVYWHSDLEGSCSNGTKTRHVNLVVACGPWRVMISDNGLHDLKHLWKGIVERMMRAGEVWTEGGFTLALFQGCGAGSKVLLEQVQLNFSFWNKFIILIPCGLLVDNNTFSKMCIFKSLTGL